MSETLTDLLKSCRSAVFFGGAGMSTESGIPDFRGTDGLYQRPASPSAVPPEVIISHDFFLRHPDIFFDYYREHLLFADAKPNAGHLALAELEQMGKLKAVITQNIDGLHRKAGSRRVLELHGSTLQNYCLSCHRQFGLEAITGSKSVPTCPLCGGIIRPDVVLYGEPLDSDVFEEAEDAIRSADLLIVGGTSLTVQPAASLVTAFRGTHTVIINKTPTPYDFMASLIIRDPVGKVLREAVDALHS